MRVNFESPQPQAPHPAPAAHAPQVSSAPLPSSGSAAPSTPEVGDRPSNVTFRREGNGRIYYVISDSQSGQEIEELPPSAVRSMADSIDQYLKQEQEKVHNPVDIRG